MEYENQNSPRGRFDDPPEEKTSEDSGQDMLSESNYDVESDGQPLSYQPQYVSGSAPQPRRKKKHMALAVSSLVLTGISVLCCWVCGFFVVPAIIGTVFGLIALIGGKDRSVRVMGGIGLAIGIIGIIINVMELIFFVMIINWGNVTNENLQTIQSIDPNDRKAIYDWMQQFFNIDISQYYEAGINSSFSPN